MIFLVGPKQEPSSLIFKNRHLTEYLFRGSKNSRRLMKAFSASKSLFALMGLKQAKLFPIIFLASPTSVAVFVPMRKNGLSAFASGYDIAPVKAF